MYDYLVVGAGLFGAVFAHEMTKAGKKCLVLEKRNHVGGNVYDKMVEGIPVHVYGAHIFHTDKKEIWDYVNQFSAFNRYTNSPVAMYKGELYNLPFNMNTFHQMWGVTTPEQAREKIEEQRREAAVECPSNLEEQALSLVGRDVYEKLIKGYTEKQWGRSAKELPAFIIKRLPVRFTYDNNYFNDGWQGIPVEGYGRIVEKLLEGAEVRLNVDFLAERETYESMAGRIVYTGAIDAFFDYCYGELEYRSLRFESEVLDEVNHQGNAVVNYTEREIPYTRIIEHKHFRYEDPQIRDCPKTVITREYPIPWSRGAESYYPVNDERNNELYRRYAQLAKERENVIFGGRLGLFRYFDMHHVIEAALELARREGGCPD